ncbi:peptidoglycan-binding protein [Leptolyngbya cf. ectocarpi LEGE 11479]|uniref:Peptidoglycan-binding protein n=1 Tax=Leptolyngbya cf. ectocarpi LEGE 11479 TaxID=1828722 RepID=A0A929FBY8_LEPEC|nr:peptidoglycan-binding protein [Leptolyngbya ectocarpi]MBE9069068.1 peptidoglycan-binding protein [Leptolyngbya cf. ectocarpi LEGE 11479]
MMPLAVMAETEDLSPEPTQAFMQLAQSEAVLAIGSTGSAVKDVQAMLALMGYYTGSVDGTYEQATAVAVGNFQTDAGLVGDGVVGPLTWQRLFPTPASLNNPQVANPSPNPELTTSTEVGDTVESGETLEETASPDIATANLPILKLDDTGPEVSRLQNRLGELNLYTGPVDGVFGGQTEQAVIRFQRQADLVVDGIVGPTTWRLLLQ